MAKHIKRYEASDGADGHLYMGVTSLLLTTRGRRSGKLRRTALMYAEDQGRYVVTVSAARADAVMRRIQNASVPVARLGTTGGDAIVLAGERPIPVKGLAERFEGWLPAYMAGAV